MVDLVMALGLPTVVVARSALGTINHTLLTLEALRGRQIAVVGVVLVGTPDAHNRDAIAEYGGVAILGELPMLQPLSAEALTRWADDSRDPAGPTIVAQLTRGRAPLVKVAPDWGFLLPPRPQPLPPRVPHAFRVRLARSPAGPCAAEFAANDCVIRLVR